ncbi:MAG: zinc ABC transporter substrate-binding protein [Rothia sp. (in: high G+C Gram-positive bacteria)]|uniref:metal ABC transporter solute-binding protein, Zn/Mn family n=1 Tax=Rothia sp. (in: high G+C Gram-positive bacteria) TaxID=1885016 RepID=UPI002709A892|nr:zinc ABC transporter substrate-binding protein [Rothia sp. (in: high G+C Gram-positive bacteria)]
MRKILPSISLLAVSALALTACGAGESTSSSTAEGGTLQVVTTTDVYADVVAAVGGDKVEVTPLIASTAVDPHSYEATSQDRLTVKDADMVVVNGGGYDTFLTEMAGTDNPNQIVVNAVEISGLFSADDLAHMAEEHSSTEEDHSEHVHSYNEHVWYDLDTMKKVADQVATELAELDPENADAYTSAAASFSTDADQLLERLTALDTEERTYLATEPVSGYLLEEAGFTDSTPEDLTAAVDSESDIAPLTMQEAKDALTGGSIDLLAFNEQTQTAQTTEIYTFAQEAGVASVSFTETLPENTGYLAWMTQNIDTLEKAVA